MTAATPNRLHRAGLIFTFLWFAIGGSGHFLLPQFFVSICPPWLPSPLAVVYLSGVIELLGAAALIPLQTRRWAGLGLFGLIVAVTPVHIYMLQAPEQFPQFPVAMLWLRLVIQPLFAANVWWSTQRP